MSGERKRPTFHTPRSGTICVQPNIGTVSKASLGRLLRDEAKRVWAIPGATMPSWAETETYFSTRSTGFKLCSSLSFSNKHCAYFYINSFFQNQSLDWHRAHLYIRTSIRLIVLHKSLSSSNSHKAFITLVSIVQQQALSLHRSLFYLSTTGLCRVNLYLATNLHRAQLCLSTTSIRFLSLSCRQTRVNTAR